MVLPDDVCFFWFLVWLIVCFVSLHVIVVLLWPGLAYVVVRLFASCFLLVSTCGCGVARLGCPYWFTVTVHHSQSVIIPVHTVSCWDCTATTEIEIFRRLRILETSWFVRRVGNWLSSRFAHFAVGALTSCHRMAGNWVLPAHNGEGVCCEYHWVSVLTGITIPLNSNPNVLSL